MVSTVKLYSLGILFFMSSVSGLVLPYFILRILVRNCHNSKSFKKVLGVLNCFTGGVFIATSLLTLLPESREAAEKAFHVLGKDEDYPVTELILGFGFLLILLIENITVSCYDKHQKKQNVKENPQSQEGGNSESQTNTDSNADNHKCNDFCASYQNGHVTVIRVRQTVDDSMEVAHAPSSSEIEAEHSQHCITDTVYSQGMSKLHSIVLMLALSIHMVFDGLSLGLLKEDDKVWSVLLALSMHKILIFFSSGITICESATTIKFVIAMLYLSFVSPLGVGLGILMTSQSDSVPLTAASAFLQALAVGTFVYVAFFEILLKEFVSGENGRILKAGSSVIGYSLFALIKYVMH